MNNYRGTGVSRQRFRMLQHELWARTWHSAVVAAIWGIVLVFLVVVAVARKADKRAWQFGICSDQRIVIQEKGK